MKETLYFKYHARTGQPIQGQKPLTEKQFEELPFKQKDKYIPILIEREVTPIHYSVEDDVRCYLAWLQDQKHRIKRVFTNAGSDDPTKIDQIICFQLSPPCDLREELKKIIKEE